MARKGEGSLGEEKKDDKGISKEKPGTAFSER
jgi:hypothetical protein